MTELALLTRAALGPLEVRYVGGSWITLETTVDAWRLGASPAEVESTIRRLLVPEMARFCQIPESCVSFHTRDSTIFPGRRLVFWLTATRPQLEPVKPEVIEI